jgi:hypothetical protein
MQRGTHDTLPDPRNENILIYVNGDLAPRPEARISVFDSGFLVGDAWHQVNPFTGSTPYGWRPNDRDHPRVQDSGFRHEGKGCQSVYLHGAARLT